MALLYRKRYIGSEIIAYEKVEKFDQIINENLVSMNSKCNIGIRYGYLDHSQLFRKMKDEVGN
ncbi:MAG: hypothetical protein PUB18_04320 [bacterium]|nr:hypothetical protein [bacterium]